MLLLVGTVNVYVPKDRVTNLHQGYGFVEFRSEEDADYVSDIITFFFFISSCEESFVIVSGRMPLFPAFAYGTHSNVGTWCRLSRS